MSGPERITLAMTGASGAQYGLRLLDCLVQEEREVHFLISKAAQLVMATETDSTWPCRPAAGDAGLPHRILRCRRRTDPRVRPERLDGAAGLRLQRAQCHGDLPVFHRHPVGGRHGGLQQPHRARRRCRPEGAPAAGAGAARGAVLQYPPGKHAQAVQPRRGDPAGGAGLLPPAAIGGGPGGLRRRANPQHPGDSPGHAAALGEQHLVSDE